MITVRLISDIFHLAAKINTGWTRRTRIHWWVHHNKSHTFKFTHFTHYVLLKIWRPSVCDYEVIPFFAFFDLRTKHSISCPRSPSTSHMRLLFNKIKNQVTVSLIRSILYAPCVLVTSGFTQDEKMSNMQWKGQMLCWVPYRRWKSETYSWSVTLHKTIIHIFKMLARFSFQWCKICSSNDWGQQLSSQKKKEHG